MAADVDVDQVSFIEIAAPLDGDLPRLQKALGHASSLTSGAGLSSLLLFP